MISTEHNQSSAVYPMGIFPASPAAGHTISQDEQPSTMGRVIRVRPNIYVFACDYCQSEHKGIDSFLRHAEGHFQRKSTGTPATSARSQRAATQIHSDCLSPTQLIRAEPIPNGHGHVPFNGYPSYQSPAHDPDAHTIDITASPSHDSDDYIEEVYEIIDLGYDPDGNKYPMAEKAAVVSTTTTNGKTKQPKSSGQTEQKTKNQTTSCPICNKTYTHPRSLRRHKSKVHVDILMKLITLKKSFKCTFCDTKFPRTNKLEAEQHMGIHLKQKSAAPKKSAKK